MLVENVLCIGSCAITGQKTAVGESTRTITAEVGPSARDFLWFLETRALATSKFFGKLYGNKAQKNYCSKLKGKYSLLLREVRA